MSGKYLAVCAILCLLFSPLGCGDDPDKPAAPAASKPAETELEKTMDASLKARARIAALMKAAKDVDSAKAIIPLLKQAVAEENKHSAALDKMPKSTAEVDKALGAKFGTRLEATTAALKQERARLEAMPEVIKIIDPVLEGE